MSNETWMVVVNRLASDKLINTLLDKGLCVMTSPDIYDMPEDNVLTSAINEYPGEALICAAYPRRAIEAILAARGVRRKVTALPIGEMSDPQIVEAILAITDAGKAPGELRDFYHRFKRRWYPLIDPQRCTNCQACVEFCLFGVYELDGRGACFVAIPDNCKTGCPSCARVCPESAIIFPHYPGGGPIAGGEGRIERVKPEQARQMGGDDVKAFRETYGDDPGEDDRGDIADAIDELESFDA